MRLLAVLLFAACGAARPQPTVIENRAALLPEPECDLPALRTVLAKRLRELERSELDVECTPGHFPAPGFFVEVRTRSRHVVGIVDAERLEEIAPLVDEPPRSSSITTVHRVASDLDRDGVDEIVETWRDDAHAETGIGHHIVVRRTEAKQLVRIDGPHVGVFHPDLGGCHAEAWIEAGDLVIDVTRIVGLAPSDCLSRGLHRFVLHGGAVVKARGGEFRSGDE